ncbi:HAD-IC family P-type ATPase [soil metagenome]
MATTDREGDRAVYGLDPDEVEERVWEGLVNHTPEGPSRTTGDIIRANVVTRFNILLGVLFVVVLVVLRQPRDALFGFVLVTNSAIGIVQELRAKQTLDRLELLTSPRSRVIRSGHAEMLPVEEIVVDDVIDLRAGDQLPVDGLVLTSSGLEINESLLTGESDPVAKGPGDKCLSASFVSSGSGRIQATGVGGDAYAARLATEAKKFELVGSELRDGINWILGGVSWAVGPMIVLLVWSQMRGERTFLEALGGGVAAAVAMIPQGLVLLASVAFAVGIIRLARQQVLVRELPAIEGLARVDTVCFDKTGTLTQGSITLNEVIVLSDFDPGPVLAALAGLEPSPNATMAALVAAYPTPTTWTTLASVPFSSARQWSGATFAGRGTWVIGAPEVIAPNHPEVERITTGASAQGLRVLVVAGGDETLTPHSLPTDLRPLAVVTLGDRVRPEAAETIRYFIDQGVRVKVISGDHPDTVGAIARQVGVVGADRVIDARRLPRDPDELARVMEDGAVFGRVTPHQKRRMVGALQSQGHVVAMTGDGVNDVLALKDSDIGIAMGEGAPASRAVAQLVLLDGRFDRLPDIVGEGRRVISNIERVANLFITSTVYAIGLSLAIVVSSLPFPFLARHLTLVGSLTIGIPAFFIALAPSQRRARPGLVGRVLKFAVPTGLAATLATFAAYQLAIFEGVSLEEARTTATLVLAAIGLFALGIVSRPLVPWKQMLIISMAGLLVLAMVLPASHDFFELELPRFVVLLAAVGIVAITGAAMVFALRAVGWVRAVPEILRENPPNERQSWRRLSREIPEISGWRRSFPSTAEMPALRRRRRPPPSDSEASEG